MLAEAHVNPTWAGKWLIMAVVLLAFGGWCIYDGLVAYPAHNRKVAAYYHFHPDGKDKHYGPTGAPAGWDPYTKDADYSGYDDYAEYAEAKGWSREAPGDPRSHMDVMMQWIQLGIVWTLMLLILIWLAVHWRTKVAADEEGLYASDGTFVPYDAVTDIDKAKWDAKGIAFVHYEKETGEKGRVKIDDWVYRDAGYVLDEVESRTGLGEPVPG